MALCAYHETTQAVAVCMVCQSDICSKCQAFGANGMCGMCVEMASANKATHEAARQARPVAPPAAAAPARPTRSGTAPLPAPARAGGSGSPPRAAPGSGRAPGKAAPLRAGMCGSHPDKAASSQCTHCAKKVCPYCLDLYDLCAECRALPQCVRHESMVGGERCAACKMSFCKICLAGTDRCDRCRTLGLTGDGEKGTRRPPRAPQAEPGALRTPTGTLGPKAGKPGPAPAGPRSTAKLPPASARPKRSPVPLVVGGVLVASLAFVALRAMPPAKPNLTPAQETHWLREEMTMVREAALHASRRDGRFPDSEAALLAALKAEGVATDKLLLPLKLAVNTPPIDPLSIAFRMVGTGFELRALDRDGRPFAVDGKPYVLRDQDETKP